jgi:hypothetical protein
MQESLSRMSYIIRCMYNARTAVLSCRSVSDIVDIEGNLPWKLYLEMQWLHDVVTAVLVHRVTYIA